MATTKAKNKPVIHLKTVADYLGLSYQTVRIYSNHSKKEYRDKVTKAKQEIGAAYENLKAKRK